MSKNKFFGTAKKKSSSGNYKSIAKKAKENTTSTATGSSGGTAGKIASAMKSATNTKSKSSGSADTVYSWLNTKRTSSGTGKGFTSDVKKAASTTSKNNQKKTGTFSDRTNQTVKSTVYGEYGKYGGNTAYKTPTSGSKTATPYKGYNWTKTNKDTVIDDAYANLTYNANQTLYESADKNPKAVSACGWIQLGALKNMGRSAVSAIGRTSTEDESTGLEKSSGSLWQAGVNTAFAAFKENGGKSQYYQWQKDQEAQVEQYVKNFEACDPTEDEYNDAVDYIQGEIDSANERGDTKLAELMTGMLDDVTEVGVKKRYQSAIQRKLDQADEIVTQAQTYKENYKGDDASRIWDKIADLQEQQRQAEINGDGDQWYRLGEEIDYWTMQANTADQRAAQGSDISAAKVNRAQSQADRYRTMLAQQEVIDAAEDGWDDEDKLAATEEFVGSIPSYDPYIKGESIYTSPTKLQIIMDPVGVIQKSQEALKSQSDGKYIDDVPNRTKAECAAFMTDKQRTTYFEKAQEDAISGGNSAEEYFDTLCETELYQKRAEALESIVGQEYEEGGVVKKVAMNATTIPAQLLGQLVTAGYALYSMASGEEYNQYNPWNDTLRGSSTIRNKTSEELAEIDQRMMASDDMPDWAKKLINFITDDQGLLSGSYGTLTNVADNLTRGALTGGLLSFGVPKAIFDIINMGTMGLTSFAESCYQNWDAYERGDMTYEEYMARNIADGANEIIQETCFGKFEWNADIVNVHSLSDAWKYLGMCGADEFLEEFMGSWLDTGFDQGISAVYGADTEIDKAIQDYMDNGYSEGEAYVMALTEAIICDPVAAGGAGGLSGLLMAGGTGFRQAFHESAIDAKTGGDIANGGAGAVAGVMRTAAGMGDAKTGALTDKLGSKLTGAGIDLTGVDDETVRLYDEQQKEAEQAEEKTGEEAATQDATAQTAEQTDSTEALEAQAHQAAEASAAGNNGVTTIQEAQNAYDAIVDKIDALKNENMQIRYGDMAVLRSGMQIEQRTDLTDAEKERLQEIQSEIKELEKAQAEAYGVLVQTQEGQNAQAIAEQAQANTQAETTPVDETPTETAVEAETQEDEQESEEPASPKDDARSDSDTAGDDEASAAAQAVEDLSSAYTTAEQDLKDMQDQLAEMESDMGENAPSMDADGNYDLTGIGDTGNAYQMLKQNIEAQVQKLQQLKEDLYKAVDDNWRAHKAQGAAAIQAVSDERAAAEAKSKEAETEVSEEKTKEDENTGDVITDEQRQAALKKMADTEKKLEEFFKSKKNRALLGRVYNSALEQIGTQVEDIALPEAKEKIRKAFGDTAKSDRTIDALARVATGIATDSDMEMLYLDMANEYVGGKNDKGNVFTTAVMDMINAQSDGLIAGTFTRFGNNSGYSSAAQQRMKIYQDLFGRAYASRVTVHTAKEGNRADASKGQYTVRSKKGDMVVTPTGNFKVSEKQLLAEVENTTNGEAVKTYVTVNSLSGISEEQAAVLETIRTIAGTDAAAASAMWKGFIASGMSESEYGNMLMMAYQYGRCGLSWQQANRTLSPNEATKDSVKAAAEKGAASRSTRDISQQSKVKGDDRGGKYTFKDSSGTYDLTKESERERFAKDKGLSKTQRAAVEVFAKFIGSHSVNVELFQSKADEDGVIRSKNGEYDPSTNTIQIDINAGMDNTKTGFVSYAMARVFSHELTHFIQSNNAEGYAQLTAAVMQSLTRAGESFYTLVYRRLAPIERREAKKAKSEQKSEQEMFDEAIDEVVASACEMMLNNSKIAKDIAEETAKRDLNLAQRIGRFISDFVDSIKQAFSGVKANSAEARLLSAQVHDFENIQRIWDEALGKAMKNGGTTANETETANAAARDSDRNEQYMDAVEAGDIETAQRMVDEAAEDAGYTVTMFHGTTAQFNKFMRGYEGIHLGTFEAASDRINYKSNSSGGRIIKAYVNTGNSMVVPYDLGSWDVSAIKRLIINYNNGKTINAMKPGSNEVERVDTSVIKGVPILNQTTVNEDENNDGGWLGNLGISSMNTGNDLFGSLGISGMDTTEDETESDMDTLKSVQTWDDLASWLKEHGVDSIRYSNTIEGGNNSESIIVMDSNQVKVADPVTYDDDGNVIPLDERFNAKSKDIRYSDRMGDYENSDGTWTTDGAIVTAENYKYMQSKAYETPNDRQARYDHRTSEQWAELHREHYQGMSQEAVIAFIHEQRDKILRSDVLRDAMPHGITFSTEVDRDATSVKGAERKGGKAFGKVDIGPLRSNEEYGFTFDLDTRCERTYTYLYLRGEIQKMIGRQLTSLEARQLIEVMRVHNYEIPCTYCYVEGKRMNLVDSYRNVIAAEAKQRLGRDVTPTEIYQGVEHARSIVAQYMDETYGNDPNNKVIDKSTATEDFEGYEDFWMPEGVTEEQVVRDIFKRYGLEYVEKIPSAKDKLSEDEYKKYKFSLGAQQVVTGFVSEWIYDAKANVPMNLVDTTADWTQTENAIDAGLLCLHRRASDAAQGGVKANVMKDYKAYVDEVFRISVEEKAHMNAMGGARIHSSNDYQTGNIINYLQFFSDLAADRRGGTGWFVHTYTKNPQFADIFSRFGARINTSIAMYGDVYGKDGNITENSEEGMSWEKAKQLRSGRANKGNCGTMLMATNNAQLDTGLNEDWIDMIIPFHASGMPSELFYDVMGWMNYTSIQSEASFNADDMWNMILASDRYKDEAKKPRRPKGAEALKAMFDETFDIIDAPRSAAEVKQLLGSEDDEQNIRIRSDNKIARLHKTTKEDSEINAKNNIKDTDPNAQHTGAEYAPHFFPFDSYDKEGNYIPGHHNDAKRYKQLCALYGCKPRFVSGLKYSKDGGLSYDGLKVHKSKDSDEMVNIGDHDGYLKLIKETARTDTKQQYISMKDDTPDEYGYTAWGMINEEGKRVNSVVSDAIDNFTGYEGFNTDPDDVIHSFIRDYIGEDKESIMGTASQVMQDGSRYKYTVGQLTDADERKAEVMREKAAEYYREFNARKDKLMVDLSRMEAAKTEKAAENIKKQHYKAANPVAVQKEAEKARLAEEKKKAKGTIRYDGREYDSSSFRFLDPSQYSEEKLNIIKEYLSSVDHDLVDFYNFVLSVEDVNQYIKPYQVGEVSKRTADKIKELTGSDLNGKPIVMSKSAVRHIRKRHGGMAHSADESMVDVNDVARIKFIIDNYDDAVIIHKADEEYNGKSEYKNSDQTPAPQIRFIKYIDGTYYAAVAAPDITKDNKKKLGIISAYAQIKKKTYGMAASDFVSAAYPTPEARSSSSSEISITQNEGNGNSNDEDEARKLLRNTQYMSAVDSGDMDTAQRLVDEAAEEAFSDSKIRGEDGKLIPVYHGTDAEFTVFDPTKARANMDIQGMFFSPWGEDAGGYGSNTRRYYLNVTNPASESTGYKALNSFKGKNKAGQQARELLISQGYDGVNNSDEEYIAFYPEQIKSADPVTYDDDGNVIPVSERFNLDNPDIRYSDRETEVTDADLLKMASEAVAETETEKKYMQMYKDTVRRMMELNWEVNEQKEAIQKAEQKGDAAEAAKGRNRLAIYQQNLEEAMQKASDLEESKPLSGVMWAIRHETEQAVLDALTEVRNLASATDKDIDEAIQKRMHSYQREIAMLHDRLKRAQDEASKANNGDSGTGKRRNIAPGTKQLLDNYEKRIKQLETRIASMNNGTAAKVAKEMQKRNTAMQAMRDRRKATQTRQRIRAIIDDFNKRLAHPKQGHYIPADMIRGIIQTLESFDLSYVRGGEEIVGKSIRDMYDVYAKYKKDGEYTFYNEFIASRLESIADEMGNTKFRNLSAEQLDRIYEDMKALHKIVTDAVNFKDLEGYKDAYEAGDKAIEQIQQAEPVLKGRWGELLNWMSSPDNFFKRLGGFAKNGVMSQMQKEFVRGEQTMLEIQREYVNTFSGLTSTKDFKNLSAHKADQLVDVGLVSMDANENGEHEPVMITRGMMLSLYMHLSSDDNIRGIARGGLKVPNLTRYYEKNPAAAFDDMKAVRTSGINQRTEGLYDQYKQQGMDDKTIGIEMAKDRQALEDSEVKRLEKLRDKIREMMSDDELAMIEAAHEWFDHKSRQYLNEVSMDMYGFKVAAVENYFPIHRDPNYLNTQFQSVANDASLANMGFLKERVKASQPVLLMDFAYEMAGSVDQTSRYVGFARAERDFNLLYRAQLPGMQTSLREQIGKKFGSGDLKMGVSGMQYIENYVNGIIGNNRSKATLWDDIRSNLARSTLTLNPRVALSQAASIPTAVAELDMESVTRAIKDIGIAFNRKAKDQLAQDDIWFWQRYRGQGGMTEFADAKKNGTKLDRIYNRINDTWFGQHFMNWCQDFDVGSTAIIHKATEYWVTKNTGYTEGTEEWKQAVADKYRDVLRRTQPMYTTTARSDLMRSSDGIMKTFTMFKTQASQNLNTLYNASAEFKKFKQDLANGLNDVTEADVREARGRFQNSIAAVGMGAIAYAFFRFLVNALMGKLKKYKDDETDEMTMMSTVKGIGLEALSSLSSMVVFGDAIWSAGEAIINKSTYYGISETAVGQISDTAEAMINVIQSAGTDKFGSKVATFMSDLTRLVGIPYDNAANVVNMASSYANLIGNGMFESSLTRTDDSIYNRAISAMLDGNDSAYEKAIAEEMSVSDKSLKEAQSGLKNRIGTWYESGALTEEEATKLLTGDKLGMDEDDVYWYMDKMNYKKKHGNTDDYTYTEKMQEALRDGSDTAIKEAMSYYTAHGYAGKTETAAKNAIQEMYESDEIDWDTAKTMLVKYAGLTDKKGEADEDDLYWVQQEWDWNKSGSATLSESSYNKYADLDKAIDASDISTAADTVKDLMGHGVTKNGVASHLASKFKQTYLEMLDVDPDAAEKYLTEVILPVYNAAGYTDSYERNYIAKHWL